VDKVVKENASAAKINQTLFEACQKLPQIPQEIVRLFGVLLLVLTFFLCGI